MRIPLVSRFSFIVYYWLNLTIYISIAFSQCREDQRSLLLQLKNNLTFGLWSSKLNSWNQNIPCCQWEGVTCDVYRQVIGLNLSGESIYDGFDNSSTLFALQHLRVLDLSNNQLNSEIPSSFNKLHNLTYLNLANAGFRGHIPMEIFQLSRLVNLDLSTLEPMKLEISSFGKLVRNLTKIEQLYLDGVIISDHGQEWNDALLQIPTLKELSMVGCNLSGPIHSSLTKLENLSVIHLDFNNLSSAVPEAFANFKNLTSLSLFGCELIGMFPQKIFQMPTLFSIDLSQNSNLHGFFPEFPLNGSLRSLSVSSTSFSGQLPNSIGNLKNLSLLDLTSSQFNGSLPNSLSNLTQLVYLYLSSNKFTGMIPSSMFMLPSLQWVILSNNKFYGQFNDFINVSIGIQWLDLSGNHLQGSIPISFFQLINLYHLILSSNMFSGTIELNMLSKLGNLTTLDISHNNLTIIDTSTSLTPFPFLPSLTSLSLASCKLTSFPQFLKNHSLLEDIDLSSNHIAGTIPQWISNNNYLRYINLSYNYLNNWEEPMLNCTSDLTFLDFHSNLLQAPFPSLPQTIFYLDFSNNNLSSTIPSEIGQQLARTVFFSLASNNLQGHIPESICNAGDLEVLDLSNNSLTGTIPKCLIAMNGTLNILDVGRNKLSGSIDTSPGLCSLRTLHLNGNSLQGKLPKYLSNCGMLEILDIGDNQIHDQFPCWLKNISTLRVLILHSNKLHGSLNCHGTEVAWPHLQIFDLASNNFGGGIPVSFLGTWKAMMIDENDGINKPKSGHLQFRLPKYNVVYYQDRVTVTIKEHNMELVKILIIFTTIDLSCNKFEGLIPKELGLLNALHILNLSHNAFLGPIPSSLGNMKNLDSLDLSHNCLTGKIPTQITNLSFLSMLNLSFNHLVGRIPTGTQIQSFPANSFKGNDGLCGSPLSQNCSGDGWQGRGLPTSISNVGTKNPIDWNFISVELGFAFGIGIIVLPLVFYKSWRIRYWKCLDYILYHIFPHLDFVYEQHGGKCYRTLRWKPY